MPSSSAATIIRRTKEFEPWDSRTRRAVCEAVASWSPDSQGAGTGSQLRLTLTLEEIAEMGLLARQCRLFSEFKKKQLLQLKGSTLAIRDRAALEAIGHS